jgi:hypothetical protein
MTLKLSNIRRFIILLSVVWFAGYASATTICANTCPDCVSISLNSCSASCSAATVPSQSLAKLKPVKPAVESPEFSLLYVSINTANIWKPPKQTVLYSLRLVI